MLYDAFKDLLSHRRMIEDLIQDRLPEWTERLGFSTLREDPIDLSDERIFKSPPDSVWSARGTAEDSDTDFMILIAIRGTTDPNMLFRTMAWEARAHKQHREKQELAKRNPSRKLETKSMVFHYGDKPWTAPTSMRVNIDNL